MTWNTLNEGARLRVVATKTLPGDRWTECLKQADCEVVVSDSRDILSTTEIREAIGARCDGAIGQLTEKWGDELFEALRAAGGRAYSNYAAGYDNVDVEAATRRGIAVGNTPGVLTETTAELAVALTFAAARRVVEADTFLRAGSFRGWLPDLFLGKRFHGAMLGVVGAGRIGSAYARRMGTACHMRVLYHDVVRNAALEEFFRQFAALEGASGRGPGCERVDDLDNLLERSDVVSVHAPLTEETHHLIDAARLSRMKADAVLVNTSRGAVIDEKALVEHLRSHPDFRVGLDVFENEPALTPGLAELSNAVIVPHIASATVWTRAGMATLAAANVAGILRGDPVAQKLDPEEFLEGDFPQKIPSVVNPEVLG